MQEICLCVDFDDFRKNKMAAGSKMAADRGQPKNGHAGNVYNAYNSDRMYPIWMNL